jgi:hypothetical protein
MRAGSYWDAWRPGLNAGQKIKSGEMSGLRVWFRQLAPNPRPCSSHGRSRSASLCHSPQRIATEESQFPEANELRRFVILVPLLSWRGRWSLRRSVPQRLVALKFLLLLRRDVIRLPRRRVVSQGVLQRSLLRGGRNNTGRRRRRGLALVRAPHRPHHDKGHGSGRDHTADGHSRSCHRHSPGFHSGMPFAPFRTFFWPFGSLA